MELTIRIDAIRESCHVTKSEIRTIETKQRKSIQLPECCKRVPLHDRTCLIRRPSARKCVCVTRQRHTQHSLWAM